MNQSGEPETGGTASFPNTGDRAPAPGADGATLSASNLDPDATRMPPGYDPDATRTPSTAPDGSATAPRTFGDYEIVSQIARGGMGVVFRAHQISLNRDVAVKMILAGQLASEMEVHRFRAEAEAAAGLDHPHILPIYEIGEHGGHHFFSMKLVGGGSLAAVLKQSPRPPLRDLIQLLATVCRAVHFAHQHGILHRDLKPANILLASAESGGKTEGDSASDTTAAFPSSPAAFRPYVTDFGLARRVEGGDTGVTRTGSVLGTPSYMAPEQARADKNPTTAVDVYSLGAILFEVVTGRPPFQAESAMETLLRVMRDEPPRPSSIAPGADRDLSVIALKCLEKDPARRYESATALADELDRWVRGEPITARPATRTERAVKWVRRNPAVAGLVAFAALLLLAGTAASTYFAITADRRADEAIRAMKQADDAKKEAEDNAARADHNARESAQFATLAAQRERDGRHRLARTSVINGNRLLDSHDWAGALLWYVEALKLDDDPERNEQHRRRVGLFLRHLPRLVAAWELPEEESPAAMDGTRLVTLRDKTIRLRDARTGAPIGAPMTADRPLLAARLSPDRKRLLTIGLGGIDGKQSTEIRLWDVPECRPASPVLVFNRAILIGDFFPAGGGVFLLVPPPDGGANNQVAIWDGVADKPVFAQGDDGPVLAEQIALSRDGKCVALLKANFVNGNRVNQTVTVHDRATWKLVPHPKVATTWALGGGDFGFDDTGTRLWVNVRGAGTASVYPLGDEDAGPYTFTVDGFREATLSPDQRQLFVSADSGLRRIDFNPTPTITPLGTGSSGMPQVAPDGMLVATWSDNAGKNLRVWQNGGQPPGSVLHHNEPVVLSEFMPDARHFLRLVQSDNLVRVWDLATSDADTIVPVADMVTAVSPQTDRLFVRDGATVVVRALSTGRRVGAPLDCRGPVRELLLSPDDRFLLSRTHAGPAIVWNVATGTGNTVAVPPLASVQFAQDGSRLAAFGGEPSKIVVFDTLTGKPTGPGVTPPAVPVQPSFSADCRFLFIPHIDPEGKPSAPRVWDSATGAEVKLDPPLPPGTVPVDLVLGSRLLARAPDGQHLTAWALPSGQQLWKVRVRLDQMPQVTDTGTGRVVAHNPARGTTVIFDADTGAQLGDFRSSSTALSPFVLPDGRRLVLYSTNPPLRVIDTRTARPLGPGFGSLDEVTSMWYRTDDRVMAVGPVLWDPIAGDPLSPPRWLGPASNGSVDGFRPDGALVESWTRRSDTYARLAGRVALVRHGETAYTGTDIAPDGRPVETLLALAEVLSGRRIDETGSVVELTSDELLARLAQVPAGGRAPAELVRWHHLMSWTDQRAGELFHLDALLRWEPTNPAWALRRAGRHLEDGDRAAALAQLDRAAALGADGTEYWLLRGWAEADGTDWSKPEAAFTKLVERDPHAPDGWEARATARAAARKWSGAGADLLKHAEALGGNFGTLNAATQAQWAGLLALHAGGDPEPLRKAVRGPPEADPDRVNWTYYALSVCAVPGALADYKPLSASAKDAWEKSAGSAHEAIAARHAGAAAYRAGQFADALKALERAYELNSLDPDTWPFLAMARHRAGDKPGAAAALKALTDYLQTDTPHVVEWVRLELLRAEAAALLAAKQ